MTASPVRRNGDGLLGPLGSSHGGRIDRIVEGGGRRVERSHTNLSPRRSQ